MSSNSPKIAFTSHTLEETKKPVFSLMKNVGRSGWTSGNLLLISIPCPFSKVSSLVYRPGVFFRVP